MIPAFETAQARWGVRLTEDDPPPDEPPLLWQRGFLIRQSAWSRRGIEVPVCAVLAELAINLNSLHHTSEVEYYSMFEGVSVVALQGSFSRARLTFECVSGRIDEALLPAAVQQAVIHCLERIRLRSARAAASVSEARRLMREAGVLFG